jgi:Raf kinase inhibitor-like YbhB/YbcL family protein
MKNKIFGTGAVVLALALGVAMAQDKGGKGGGKGPAGPGLTLTSPDFIDGGVIDDKYSQKGGQKGPSPKLEWTNVPNGVVSFAILFHDPDGAPGKKSEDVTHWMAFNIPAAARSLGPGVGDDAKLSDGTVQIKNTRGAVGYMGPGAGAAGPYHHYTFELFALDTMLDLGPDATRVQVMAAMDGHILAKGVDEGRFHQ